MDIFILVFNLFMFVLGIFIIYRVILLAVREGINQSMIGEFIRKKYNNQNNLKNDKF